MFVDSHGAANITRLIDLLLPVGLDILGLQEALFPCPVCVRGGASVCALAAKV
jgi:hypothetical protein